MTTYTSPPSFPISQSTTTSNFGPLTSDLSPSSLDTLPVLTAVLTRLQNTPPSASTTSGSPQPTSVSQSQSISDSFSTAPLTTKDIPAATDALRSRLQKARMQIKALPDMQRGLEEQEEEIRELEERIKMQKLVLERLKGMGGEKMVE